MPSQLEYEYMAASLCPAAVPRTRGVLLVDEFKRLWGPNGEGGHSRLDFGPMRVDGVKALGNTLTATLAGGMATGFQWYRSGVAIAGATDIRSGGTQSQYVLTALDLAAGVEITMQATGFVPTASAGIASAIAPTTAAPTFTGTPTVGSPVTYTAGAVTGSPTPTVTITATVAGIPVALPYTPLPGDAGATIVIRQTVSNAGGTSFTESVGFIQANVVAPTVATAPAIVGGSGNVGVSVSYTPGTFSGSAATITRQFTLDGVNVGASAPAGTAYTPAATGVLRVVETATNSAGTATSTSAPITIAAAVVATNPRFGYAPALLAGDTAGLGSLFASMTNLTGSATAGRAGTFNTVGSIPNFTWVAVLQSAVGASIRIFDGVGYGGFSGAGSAGIYLPGEFDPTTLHLVYTDGSANVWNMYRSDSKAVTFSTFTLS